MDVNEQVQLRAEQEALELGTWLWNTRFAFVNDRALSLDDRTLALPLRLRRNHCSDGLLEDLKKEVEKLKVNVRALLGLVFRTSFQDGS